MRKEQCERVLWLAWGGVGPLALPSPYVSGRECPLRDSLGVIVRAGVVEWGRSPATPLYIRRVLSDLMFFMSSCLSRFMFFMVGFILHFGCDLLRGGFAACWELLWMRFTPVLIDSSEQRL
jgi:hypothetical protein